MPIVLERNRRDIVRLNSAAPEPRQMPKTYGRHIGNWWKEDRRQELWKELMLSRLIDTMLASLPIFNTPHHSVNTLPTQINRSTSQNGKSFRFLTICATQPQASTSSQHGSFDWELQCSVNLFLAFSTYLLPPLPYHNSGSELPSSQCRKSLHPRTMRISALSP